MDQKACAARVGGLVFTVGLGVAMAANPGVAVAAPDPGSPDPGPASSSPADSPAGGPKNLTTPKEPNDQTGAKGVSGQSPQVGQSGSNNPTNKTLDKTGPESEKDKTPSGVANQPAPGDKETTPAKDGPTGPAEEPSKLGPVETSGDKQVEGPPVIVGQVPPPAEGAEIVPDQDVIEDQKTPPDSSNSQRSTSSRNAQSLSVVKAPDATLAARDVITIKSSTTAVAATVNGAAKAVSATPGAAPAAVNGLAKVAVDGAKPAPLGAAAPSVAAVAVPVQQQIAAAVKNFLTAIGLGALAAPAPNAPTESPGMWAVLAWTRRQLQQALSPTVQTPTTTSELAVAKTAVTAAAVANTPPVATSPPTASTPNATTGVVTGSLGVTDANGDTLAYTVSGAPARGNVVVAANGTYTYTPTQAGRYIAGTTSGVDVDAFTVSVTDGKSSPISVRVTPTVAPVVAQLQTVAVGTTPTAVVAGADGRAYVLNTGTKTINVIYPNGATFAIPAGNAPFEGDLALSPDGSRLYVSQGTSNTVLVYDTSSGAVLANFPVSYGATGIVTSGSRVYVANFNSRTVSIVDAGTYQVLAEVPVGKDAYKLSVSPDGQRVYVTSFQGTTQVLATINTVTGAVTQQPFSTQNSAFSPDGTRLYLTTPNSLSILDPRPTSPTYNQVVATIAVPNAAFVAVSPDGSLAYVTQPNGYNGANDTIAVIDTKTLTVIGSIPVGDYPFEVTVSPDGSRIYAANASSNTVSLITLKPA